MRQRRRKKTLRLILLVLLLIFIVIQLIPVDRSVPDYDPAQDFLAQVNADQEIATLIRNACYDCHSYETEYPWYAYVAPVSKWIQGHIDHGRDECNFSLWGTFDAKRKDHKLEECAELVSEGSMPLSSYTNLGMHPEARLTDTQRTMLAEWFEGLRAGGLNERGNRERESEEREDD